MSQWISLSSSDDRFLSYLKGTFSDHQRAIPQQTLKKDTGEEEVIFKIFEMAELNHPPWWKVWLETTRYKYLSFTAMPMLSALALILYKGWSLNFLFTICSFLGVLCLQVSAHLFNDYSDHFRGWDRLQPGRGSRSIQNGWLTAVQVKRGGFFFCALALLLGSPAVLQQPKLLAVMGLLALLGVIEFSSNRLALKYRGLGELTLMVLSGPLVTLGFSLAVSGRFDLDTIVLGLVFGFLSSYVYYLKNIEELMRDFSRQHSTLAVALGFDRAKRLAQWAVWGLPVGLLSWSFTTAAVPVLLATIVVLQKTYLLSRQVNGVMSTLSSGLGLARTQGIQLHMLTGFALALSFILFSLF